MATKIQPGRARFRIGGVSVPLWLPTRAERIALDIARQKNAEFLAKQSIPEPVRDAATPGATHGN